MVGAGAAGLTAAYFAASQGAQVLIMSVSVCCQQSADSLAKCCSSAQHFIFFMQMYQVISFEAVNYSEAAVL